MIVAPEEVTAAPEPLQRAPAARLANVSKRYRLGSVPVPALHRISLEIPQCQFTVIHGPSGSGKTTLLNLLGCLDVPDDGALEIARRDVLGMSDDERAGFRARHIGFVFQHFNLLPVLSARENVEYPLQLTGEQPARRRKLVEQALGAVGLLELGGRRPAELSGGQRQRVAIARALVKNPTLVLADEPTANLDRRTGQEIIGLMRSIQREQKATFVFCSHDPQLLETADFSVRIVDGRVERTDRGRR